MKKRGRISAVLLAFVLVFGTVSQVAAVNGGSVSFDGTNQYLSVPGSADWAVGTGDFTVEWFQYHTSAAGDNARVFSVGSWPNASIGVSLEGSPSNSSGRTLYVWLAGSYRLMVPNVNILNEWVHFAVTRSGTTLRVFRNGTQIGSSTDSTNVTDSTTEFRVGAETFFAAYFGGYISNFHFVKGTALYTSAFTPAGPISPVANSKLLLKMNDAGSVVTDSSGTGKTVTAENGAAFAAATPFPWTGGGPTTSSTTSTTTSTTTTTTTSTTTTTTTTTLPSTTANPSSTTSVAPVSTVAPSTGSAVGGTTNTVGTGTQPLSPTSVTTSPATTVPRAQGAFRATTTTTSTTSTTTTTTTTVPELPAPEDVPAVEPGETAAVVDGMVQPVTTERRDNEIRLTVGPVRAAVGAYGADGQMLPLSSDGAVVIEPGGKIVMSLEGLAANSKFTGVLYSDPVLLGSGTADAKGRLLKEFSIPDVEVGSHRFVVSLVDDDNREMSLTYGVVLPGEGEGVGITTVVLIVLGLGTGVALFLPAALKRRRRTPA